MNHLADTPTTKIGHTPVANLAVSKQGLNGAQRLFQTHAVVITVQIVDVQMIGPQPLQAVLAGTQHPGPRVAPLIGSLGQGIAHLAGQNPVLPLALKQFAHHLL